MYVFSLILQESLFWAVTAAWKGQCFMKNMIIHVYH